MDRTRSEVRVGGSPTRCPYCHAGIEDAEVEASVVCHACLARHHRDCWVGSCASCQAARAAELATVPVGDPTRPYEAWKRRFNHALLAWAALIFVGAFVLGNMDNQRVSDVGGLILGGGLAFLWMVAGFMNLYDAGMRFHRDRSTGVWPVAVALLGLPTCGVASAAYYLRWGWQPLPPALALARPPGRSDAAKVKGE